jgi:hypothetical protein
MTELTQAEFLKMMEQAGYDSSAPHIQAYAGFSWSLLHKAIIDHFASPSTTGGNDREDDWVRRWNEEKGRYCWERDPAPPSSGATGEDDRETSAEFFGTADPFALRKTIRALKRENEQLRANAPALSIASAARAALQP